MIETKFFVGTRIALRPPTISVWMLRVGRIDVIESETDAHSRRRHAPRVGGGERGTGNEKHSPDDAVESLSAAAKVALHKKISTGPRAF